MEATSWYDKFTVEEALTALSAGFVLFPVIAYAGNESKWSNTTHTKKMKTPDRDPE